MAFKPLPKTDLNHILTHTEPLWDELRGARLFITGGTGFFGKWWLESIMAANDNLNTEISATILSRDPERFLKQMPHLESRREFQWIKGDITTFEFPLGEFSHVIHLATAASAELNDAYPQVMLSTIVDGTRRVLDFARQRHIKRLLLASSGAVYGTQPEGMTHIPESYLGGPDPLASASAYAEGKRMAELVCALTPEVECVIARCFAFIGPHLPLDAHFAAGNFLRDALAGGPIVLHGDGRSVRSYLHSADLMIWLLALLVRGQSGSAYNVGGNEEVTTLELARKISDLCPTQVSVQITEVMHKKAAHRYIPSIEKIALGLGLRPTFSLDESIARTIRWLGTAEEPA